MVHNRETHGAYVASSSKFPVPQFLASRWSLGVLVQPFFWKGLRYFLGRTSVLLLVELSLRLSQPFVVAVVVASGLDVVAAVVAVAVAAKVVRLFWMCQDVCWYNFQEVCVVVVVVAVAEVLLRRSLSYLLSRLVAGVSTLLLRRPMKKNQTGWILSQSWSPLTLHVLKAQRQQHKDNNSKFYVCYFVTSLLKN